MSDVGTPHLHTTRRRLAYALVGAAPWLVGGVLVDALRWTWLIGPADPDPLFVMIPLVVLLGTLGVYVVRRERSTAQLLSGLLWASVGYFVAFLAWVVFVVATAPKHGA